MLPAATSESVWRDTLEAMAQREAPVDVALYREGNEDAIPWTRTRLVRFDAQGLVLQHPQRAGGKPFTAGKVVQMLVVSGLHRWRFVCTIAGVSREALNATTRVAMLRLAWPTAVYSAQRRDFFRVATETLKLPLVVLEPIADAQAISQPPEFVPRLTAPPKGTFKARMLNISAGGLGLEAPLSAGATLPHYLTYRCLIDLPAVDASLDVRSTLVHLKRQPDGTHYMGLRFEFRDAAHQRNSSREIERFTTWAQRQQLHRVAERERA